MIIRREMCAFQIFRVRAVRGDSLVADGLAVPRDLGGLRWSLRVARRLLNKSGAVHSSLGGSFVLHALREHAQQSVQPAIERRPNRGEQHEREHEHRDQVGAGVVQRATLATEVDQPLDRRVHREQAHVGIDDVTRLQAASQAIRSCREEPVPFGIVSFSILLSPLDPSRLHSSISIIQHSLKFLQVRTNFHAVGEFSRRPVLHGVGLGGLSHLDLYSKAVSAQQSVERSWETQRNRVWLTGTLF